MRLKWWIWVSERNLPSSLRTRIWPGAKFIDNLEGSVGSARKVDRWNFGTCLDAFNFVGRVSTDPASQDSTNGPTLDGDQKASLSALVQNVGVKKMWQVQVVGA